MKYVQLNAEERSAIATLKRLGWSVLEMARELQRHRSTVARELARNATPHDGWYRAGRAHERAVARRRRFAPQQQFGQEELGRWRGGCGRNESGAGERVSAAHGRMASSHEPSTGTSGATEERREPALHLRCAQKQCRKR